MAKRKHRVLARNPDTNNVQLVYRTLDGGFTRDENEDLATNVPGLYTEEEAAKAMVWGKKHGLAMYSTTSKYPFVVLDTDTEWGSPKLSAKLNELGRRRMRYMWVGEYDRTARRQWELRMAFLSGNGNLAARCCSKYTGKHKWRNCGKDSWSNHADGNAADTSYLHSGRGGPYTNVGNDHRCRAIMHDIGLCLPVGPPVSPQSEPWHVEIGNSWRA